MAHYQMKCPCCAYVVSNNTVKFDVQNTFRETRELIAEGGLFSRADLRKSGESVRNAEEKKDFGRLWDEEYISETEAKGDFGDLSGKSLMTLSEIREFCRTNGFTEPECVWRSVSVTEDFKDRNPGDDDDKLLTAVRFQQEAGGPMLRAEDRYCPECGCPLPSQSGEMPTYVVTLMGTSNSGKTVYLCALNWVLARNQVDLPYQSGLTGVSASSEGESIEKMSQKMFQEDILPGTTTQLFTKPIVLQIVFEKDGKRKNCLLALNDMRGEDLSYEGKDHLRKRVNYFKNADAFMMIISPLNIPVISEVLQGPDSSGNNANVHSQLIKGMENSIMGEFRDRRIEKPAVIMLSKSDLLCDYADELGIPRWNAVVAKEPDLQFTKTYFENHDKGARRIAAADEVLYTKLNQYFDSAYYTSVSSVGKGVIIAPDEAGNIKIKNHNNLNPFRIIDPIVYLLIRLGFLPEFHKMEGGKKHEAANEAVLSRWLSSHT